MQKQSKYKTLSGLKQGKTNYKYRGSTITNFHADNEFEHIHNFSTIPSTYMLRKLAHWVNQEIHMDDQGASYTWMSFHTLQEVHKMNGNIPGTIHYNLFKNVTTSKLYNK